MNCGVRALLASAGVAAFFSVCAFGPAASPSLQQDCIVTAAPAYDPLAALRGRERFPAGAQLLLIHDGRPSPLVADFAATADSSVSFDATRVLFAGKKDSHDVWQIYELTLADRALRQVTHDPADAIRPLYLPEGRIVYAQRTPQGFRLETRLIDAPAVIPGHMQPLPPAELALSSIQGNAIPADVLADGRILFESTYPLGSGATPELYLVYSDGSGVESYRCDHGAARWGGRELASGDVVFAAATGLARFTSPLAHAVPVAAPRAAYAGAVSETPDGAWLVSARTAGEARFALHLFNPGAATLTLLIAQPGQNLVEPVVVAPRPRPHRHPSALHPWDYANLLALDARISRDGALRGTPATVRLETQDAAGHATTLGTAPVESDGSFFVSVPGDRPIRFALLDAHGAVLRQERGWFWARAGEQRYCVGCHAGPERAPENRVPAVLTRSTTPVDLTGAKAQSNAGGR